MAVPTSDSGATADLGTSEAGGARKLLLDEMLAERERAPLPPAPVLTLRPVPVDAAPVGAGRRAVRQRLAEVEALARTNLRAAEEAQRVMQEERALLEEEASARTKAERTASALRRELERLRSTEEQRAAQAQFAATRQAKSELATEMERVHDEHSRVVDELDRMRGTLLDHDSLLDEYSQRLHDEQQAQARARADLVRAEEAQRVAERNLEISLETARRRAEDDHSRFVKVEALLHETIEERDRATTELLAITTGDGELARLRAQATATHEDMTRLLADLDVQAARADKAETELAAARDACEQAERVAAEAVEARDLSGIALETTRSELAARNELLDAERSTAQTRVADLTAQLATTTRTAESATERVTDLEARLDDAIADRTAATARADALADQLERATADADQLRTHAASIGDELAASHAELESAREDLERTHRDVDDARHERDEARRRAAVAPVPAASPPAAASAPADAAPVQVPPELTLVPPAASSPFDAALASAFGDVADTGKIDTTGKTDATGKTDTTGKRGKTDATKKRGKPATVSSELGLDNDESEGDGPAAASLGTGFRTVESTLDRTRSGGPVLEREEALVRQVVPADPTSAAVEDGDAAAGSGESAAAKEPPAWRRTAMAELTALAADSDDLTPHRRR